MTAKEEMGAVAGQVFTMVSDCLGREERIVLTPKCLPPFIYNEFTLYKFVPNLWGTDLGFIKCFYCFDGIFCIQNRIDHSIAKSFAAV